MARRLSARWLVAVADAAVDDFALDGNANGGMLMEIFGSDMTMAVAICGSCGAVGCG